MPNINDPVFDEPREQPGLGATFRSADAVDYYDGEQPPTICEE